MKRAPALLLALTCVTGCRAADAATRAPAPPGVGADAAAECVLLTTRLLEQDLIAVVEGRSRASAPDPAADKALQRKVETAHQELLLTATADLLGPFGRDVRGELRAYGGRVRAACAS